MIELKDLRILGGSIANEHGVEYGVHIWTKDKKELFHFIYEGEKKNSLYFTVPEDYALLLARALEIAAEQIREAYRDQLRSSISEEEMKKLEEWANNAMGGWPEK